METAFSKVLNSNRLRELNKVQKAFYAFRANAVYKSQKINVMPKLIYEKMKIKVKNCVSIYERQAK